MKTQTNKQINMMLLRFQSKATVLANLQHVRYNDFFITTIEVYMY